MRVLRLPQSVVIKMLHPSSFTPAYTAGAGPSPLPLYGKLPHMTTVTHYATQAPPMTQRRIFLFWLPLAASWLLMGAEMPFVNAALARLDEAERMIAAFGIVASLS